MTPAQIVAATTITQVWVGLGGEPPKRGRARAFYRDGDNLDAVSLNDTKGCWHDFKTGEFGGVLDLIRIVLGCDRCSSARWLAEFTGLPLNSHAFTFQERREYAQRLAQAERLAVDVADFEHGLELFLARRVENAANATECLLGLDVDPGGLLQTCHSDLHALRAADPETLVRTFRGIPDRIRRRFADDGRHDRENAADVTNGIVQLFTLAEIPRGAAA